MLRLTAAQARNMGISRGKNRTVNFKKSETTRKSGKPGKNQWHGTTEKTGKNTKKNYNTGQKKHRRQRPERLEYRICQWDAGTFPGGIWVRIPEIPPSMNVWMKWRPLKQHNYKQDLTTAIKLLALAANLPEYRLATVEIIYYFPEKRTRDLIDNYCPKFLMDALVKGGLLEDDRSDWVEVPRPRAVVDRAGPKTEIFIRPKGGS